MKLKKICLGLFFSFLFSTSLTYADIKVGTVLFNPPFVASSDSGFDIDLIQEICKRMHENCTLVPMKYYQLFSAVAEGQVDIVIAGIFISAERRHKYLFSLPYLMSNAQFLVLKENTTSTITDLAGKKVGLIEQDKTLFYTYLLKYFNNNLQILFFEDIDSVIAALSKGAIDAAFLPAPAADYWLRNGGNQFKFLGGHIALGSGVAIMASPNELNLIDTINKQLKAMMEDGTYLKIYNNYFFH